MAFVTITAGQTDANSPVDQLLMDTIRENLDDLDAARVTNGDSHDHVGGDGAAIPEGGLASAAVDQPSLKTSQSSVSVAATFGNSNTLLVALPGGEYGFYPRTRYVGTAGGIVSGPQYNVDILNYNHSASGSYDSGYITYIYLSVNAASQSAGTHTIYAQQRHVDASPPYKIGNKVWGHFLFVLRRISDGFILGSYESNTPPWAFNGLPNFDYDGLELTVRSGIEALILTDEYILATEKGKKEAISMLTQFIKKREKDNHKNNIARIASVPHPFANYLNKNPAIDGLEIQLIDLMDINVGQWKRDNPGKEVLGNMDEFITNPKGMIRPIPSFGLGNMPGFTDIVKIRARS